MRPFSLAFAFVLIFLLCCGGVPGFRDGAHFYGPLLEFLQQEFSSGRFPLWNPYENLGQPFAANPTNLVFYPPLLVSLGLTILTGQDAVTAYRFFMLGHVLLAMATCYRLARCRRCGSEAATLAALAYALSGSVLFQWHNAPFLIGAAWFPEALRQADLAIRKGRGRAKKPIVGLAAVLALMILGGDVQAAYHAGLCSVALALSYRFSPRRLLRSTGRLFLAGFLAFGFAAVLILPAMELATLSDRSLSSHAAVVLRYSVPPWRLLEFLWPGAGGWQFPVNARWFSGFSPEYGIWTPSHYMGLFTIPLALAVLVSPRFYRNRQSVVLGLLLLLFLLAGLGHGFGVYEQLYRFLPGYALFRYPAKLFTVVSLLLAILAGWGFDHVWHDPKARCRFGLALILLPMLAGIGIVLAFQFGGSRVPPCPLFGPYQPEAAWFGLKLSAVSVLSLVLIGLVCLRLGKIGQLILPIIVAIDLFVANTWLMAPVRPEDGRMPPSLAVRLAAENSNQVAPVRIYRFPVLSPLQFAQTASPSRIAEAWHWERETLLPRFPLSRNIAVVNVRGTMMPREYRLETQRVSEAFSEGKPGEFETALRQLGVQYVLAQESVRIDGIHLDSTDLPGISLWKLREPSSRDYVRFEPDRIVFEVTLEKPETIMLWEQFWPDWQAWDANGRRFPVVCMDKIFRGVELPAGRHRITMCYRPPQVYLGLIVTVLAVVAGGLALRTPCSARQKRRPHRLSLRP